MRLLLIACALLLSMGERAHADWALDFVRISCIPEARYFEIQFRALSGPDILIGGAEHNDKARADRLQIMADHGFFDPSNLFYECKLPDSTYTVASNQLPPSERGQCGGAPPITLNWTRNDKKWLDGISFGSDCFGGPTVTRVSVRDGKAGWGERTADLCITPSSSARELCNFLLGDGVESVMPTSQQDLTQYVEFLRTQKSVTQDTSVIVGGEESLESFKSSKK